MGCGKWWELADYFGWNGGNKGVWGIVSGWLKGVLEGFKKMAAAHEY